MLHVFNPATRIQALRLPVAAEVEAGEVRTAVSLAAARPAGSDFLLTFAGMADRDQVAALTNGILRLPRALLPAPRANEVFVEDLVGCEVFTPQGQLRGRVRATFWNGAHDVLTVVDEAGVEFLVPAVPEFLLQVDGAARRLVIDDHE